MKKVGFTIGKFAPLHKGHQYLIEVALNEMDEFYVVIYETDRINIPIEKRASWIQKLYPTVHIRYAYHPPKQYGLDEQSVKIQMDYLKPILKDIPVTHFYSSEKYGEKVAKSLGIEERKIDEKRLQIPISATIIRKNIEQQKEQLEEMVYQDYLKYQKIGEKK